LLNYSPLNKKKFSGVFIERKIWGEMAFTYKNKRGITYYLHTREGRDNSGRGKLFFFSKKNDESAEDKLPAGYKVDENQRTGLPFVKKES